MFHKVILLGNISIFLRFTKITLLMKHSRHTNSSRENTFREEKHPEATKI